MYKDDPTNRIRSQLIDALLGLAKTSKTAMLMGSPLIDFEAALLKLLVQIQNEGEILPFEDIKDLESGIPVALQIAEQRVKIFDARDRLHQLFTENDG